MYDNNMKQFRTSCEKCVFAQFNTETQTGCDLGRLEKFKKTNRTEEHENHYQILGICNTCRGEKWANNYLGKNLVAQVQKEIEVKLDFVLLSINNDPIFIHNELPDLVLSCINQKRIKPKNIIIVVKNKALNYKKLYNDINEMFYGVDDIKFQLMQVIDPDSNIDTCLDMGVAKCKSHYFASFELGSNIPLNLITVLNTKLNHELKRINLVEPTRNFDGMILQTMLYKLFGKNHNMPIYEKIIETKQHQDSPIEILKWDELWTPE